MQNENKKSTYNQRRVDENYTANFKRMYLYPFFTALIIDDHLLRSSSPSKHIGLLITVIGTVSFHVL